VGKIANAIARRQTGVNALMAHLQPHSGAILPTLRLSIQPIDSGDRIAPQRRQSIAVDAIGRRGFLSRMQFSVHALPLVPDKSGERGGADGTKGPNDQRR
jgi:hypothetical protein